MVSRFDILINVMETYPEFREWHTMSEILNQLEKGGHIPHYDRINGTREEYKRYMYARSKFARTVRDNEEYGYFESRPIVSTNSMFYKSVREYRYLGSD